MYFFSATEVVSWHMFELSGRLLCPYRSHNVALAPFSQNSAACGSGGLAQAQELHMKPPGLFCTASVPRDTGRARLCSSACSRPFTEPQPPTGWS